MNYKIIVDQNLFTNLPKPFFRFLSIVGFLIIGLVGCKKQNINTYPLSNEEITQNFQISSNGRLLKFKSIEDYMLVVNNPTNDIKRRFLKEVSTFKHVTYAEKIANSNGQKTNNLIEDEYLAQILNEDLVVQIGSFLYKVNPESEKVFVISDSSISAYNDLIMENISNNNIRQFSTDDYVIYLAEGWGDIGSTIFCGEDGCGHRDQETEKSNIPVLAGKYFMGSATYYKYGIYFSLKAEAISNTSLVRIYIDYENAWDKVKCGAIHGATSNPWFQNNPEYSMSQTYRKFMGVRPLNGLHLKIRIRCEVGGYPQGTNSYTTYFTPWIEIEANSPY